MLPMTADQTAGATPASKSDLIVTLSRAGYGPAVVARLIGSTPGSVRARKAQLRRQGVAIDAGGPSEVVRVDVPGPIMDAIREQARRRGLSQRDLVGMIVAVVIRDGMIDAVLDDDGGAAYGR